MQHLQCAAGVAETAMSAVAGLGRWWCVGVAVLLLSGVFQLSRRHSATTVQRALPVCVWSVLGMPWGTARSNTASALCSRCGGACTGCLGHAGQVVCGGCGFAAGYWNLSREEAALGNQSAQSPASVCVVSPRHVMRHSKVKCSLCRDKHI